MAEQGKYSQARAKSAAAEGRPTDDEMPEPASSPAPAAVPRASEPAEPGIRRVRGVCGQAAPSIVVGRDEQATGDSPARLHAGGNAREVASQIRAVRARLLAANNGNPPQVIMVTSGAVGEGKTTIALNLAAALAEADPSGRVVVVDGDLPKPDLHVAAGLTDEAVLGAAQESDGDIERENTTGLRRILEDDLNLDGNVFETTIPGLDLIPGFIIPVDDGTRTRLSEKCRDLLEKLRKHYAFVVVDTPPVHVDGQAAALAKHCDGVLVVVQLEKTAREAVTRTIADLQNSGAKKITGCVLTHHKHHVPSFIYRFFGSLPGSYYGSGYGYGYGYGHGYGYGRGKRRDVRRKRDQARTKDKKGAKGEQD